MKLGDYAPHMYKYKNVQAVIQMVILKVKFNLIVIAINFKFKLIKIVVHLFRENQLK